MKTLGLLSLTLAVILGAPVPPSGVEKHPAVLGDSVPVQGHVIVENPAPQMAPVDLKPEEIKGEPEDEPAPEESVEAQTEIKQEMEEELQAEPDFKVKSEVKVEPGAQMDPEEELNPEVVTDERRIDMERRLEFMSEPEMESELLDDDSMFGEEEDHEELSEEDLKREDSFAELTEEEEEKEDLVEDEEEFLGKNVLEDQPIMEVEAEGIEEPFQSPADMSVAAVVDEETLLDTMEQQMKPENYVPDEEAGVEMFSREGQLFKASAVEDGDTGHSGFSLDNKGRYCPSMVSDGKCYLFFRKPKTHSDAEFFCQQQFPGGHLASITSQQIHREVMRMILTQNGAYTRTWVGGRRLDSRRFFWLDGSLWSYSDWLTGEPNNTSGVEDCVEVLHFGNGKFNDFPCWNRQPFICSYRVQ